jgi:WAS/WASL-interacting protein
VSGYLQRLFDRSAATLPSQPVALPGGPSLSPVAEADQRLNDPALAGRFDLQTSFADEADAPEAEPFAISAGTGNRATASPAVTPIPPPPTPSEPPMPRPVATPVDPGSTLPAPSVQAPPRSAWRPPTVGDVAPEDWVIEPEPAANPLPRSQQPEAAPEPPPPPSRPTAHRAATAEAHSAGAEPSRAAAPPPEAPVSLRPLVEPSRNEPSPVTARAPEPTDRVLVRRETETTTMWVEPASSPPLPPLLPERETMPSPPPAPQVVERTVVTSPPAAASPEPAARLRPLTANEASLIGPLSKRRRALTLFGLRRR